MGNEQSSNNWGEWQEVQGDLLGCAVLVRSTMWPQVEAEKYVLEVDNTNVEREHNIYRLRKNTGSRVVAVYEYGVGKKCWGCIRDRETFWVCCERMVARLSALRGLTLSEGAYVLHECLEGYRQLGQFGWLCYPHGGMVGIKHNAEVKVWVNSNWSLSGHRRAQSEEVAVEELVRLVEGHCSHRNMGFHHIFKNGKLDFQTAIRWMKKNYAHLFNEGRFFLQRRINSIVSSQQHQTRPRTYSEGMRKTPTNSTANYEKPPSQPSFHGTNTTNSRKYQGKKPLSQTDRVENNVQQPPTQYLQSQPQNIIYPNTQTKLAESVLQMESRKLKYSVESDLHAPNVRKNIDQPCYSGNNLDKIPAYGHTNLSIPNIGFNSSAVSTKKYLNFIYKNEQSPISSSSFNSPYQQLSQSSSRKLSAVDPGKVPNFTKYRDRVREHLIHKNIQQLTQKPLIESHEQAYPLLLDENKNYLQDIKFIESQRESEDIGSGKHAIREIESFQLRADENQFSTPLFEDKNSQPITPKEFSSSLQMAEQFKYYLRSAQNAQKRPKQGQISVISEEGSSKDFQQANQSEQILPKQDSMDPPSRNNLE